MNLRIAMTEALKKARLERDKAPKYQQRHYALVITKLEEALMWFGKIDGRQT